MHVALPVCQNWLWQLPKHMADTMAVALSMVHDGCVLAKSETRR